MTRLAILTVILSLSPVCAAQTEKKLALTPNSTVSSGDVLSELSKKHCAGIVLTGDSKGADYMLEFDKKEKGLSLCSGSANCPKSEYSATLFSPSGNVLFQTKSHVYSVVTIQSAMRDVCREIGRQK